MGKIIAVWGTPNSGKTAFTMKLAGHLYEMGRRRQTKVVAVLTDVIAPSMPVVFPLYRSEDIYSLGELLAKTTITADDIFSYTTLLRGRENFGVLGYRDKENAHSHPAYTGEKALSFLNILAANTDYVLVDCMSEPEDSTVSYDANGGSGAPGSQTKTENVTLTLSPVSPRRTGYTFKGWATNKFMPGAQYQPGGKYTANASVTLYALWDCAHSKRRSDAGAC